jgi:tetratricopeptide (TPR) repeat protein
VSTKLAFSYNCLEQYREAIAVLQKSLRADPTNVFTHKELIYAQLNSQQLKKAANSCKKALKVCTDQSYNAVNSYGVLFQYYVMKDEKNFNFWLAETRKWLPYAKENADFIKRHALVMEHSFATK